MDNGFDRPEDVAMYGFPADLCRVVACRVNGDDAYVLLDTGSPGHPYLYGQHARRIDGRWQDAGSGNASGWHRTDERIDIGLLAFWGEAPSGADAVRVVFGEMRVEESVVRGGWLVVWWWQPPPGTAWPSVEAHRIGGVWTPV